MITFESFFLICKKEFNAQEYAINPHVEHLFFGKVSSEEMLLSLAAMDITEFNLQL